MPSYNYDATNPGAAVSNREDLMDLVVNIDPANTPLLALAYKTGASNETKEFTLDRHDDPSTEGSLPGTDIESFDDAYANLTRLSNTCQRFIRSFGVSDYQQHSDSVIANMIAAAQVKTTEELARDVEATFLSDNDKVTGGAGVKPKMRGIGDWLDSAGPTDVPSMYRTPAASIKADSSALTETAFNDIIASIFSQTGVVSKLTVIAGTVVRRSITEFTRADTSSNDTTYTVTQGATEKKVTFAVNLYDSDFGYISIINGNPKCMPSAERAYIIDPSHIGVATFEETFAKRLEDRGGGPRGFVRCSKTLIPGSPLAHGKITDVTA